MMFPQRAGRTDRLAGPLSRLVHSGHCSLAARGGGSVWSSRVAASTLDSARGESSPKVAANESQWLKISVVALATLSVILAVARSYQEGNPNCR